MSAQRIPDRTDDLIDVDPSCRIVGRIPKWDGTRFQGVPDSYVHNQVSPAAVWDVVHNMGRYPAVNVVDTGGTEWTPDVQYLTVNTLRITFGAPFSGKAFLT